MQNHSEKQPEPGPTLSLRERDRRWHGLREIMRRRQIDAIIVGSFQGRERLESYLIDDFLDSVVILPLEGDPTVLAFATGRISRGSESERRGFAPWVADIRVGGGGGGTAAILHEKSLGDARIGVVGFGPTAPGEMEGLLPLGFHKVSPRVCRRRRSRISPATSPISCWSRARRNAPSCVLPRASARRLAP